MTQFETGTGFSIELADWRLEHRGQHEGLPLYEALGGRITDIALVVEPAIGVNVVADDSNRTITGPVMIPDLKILRGTGPNGRSEYCYWYFSAETIAQLKDAYHGKSLKLGH